jgi:hypothetical protein
MTSKANLAASGLARLLNCAKETGDDHQTLLTSYCLERFLYRLGVSDRRERFVLKGAMLLRLWSDRPYRATRDLDLLRRGDGAVGAIQDDLRAIVATPVPISCDRNNRFTPTDTASPTTSPSATGAMPCRSTHRQMWSAVAPIAMRTPISRVRRPTECAITAY